MIEGTEAAGEATPGIGTVFNLGKAGYHDYKAWDARQQGDTAAESFYQDQAFYDITKATPGVGTALGVAELAGGAVGAAHSYANGASAKGTLAGAVGGMDSVKDHTMDLGAMGMLMGPLCAPLFGGKIGIPGVSEPGPRGHWGAHSELREKVEGGEK